MSVVLFLDRCQPWLTVSVVSILDISIDPLTSHYTVRVSQGQLGVTLSAGGTAGRGTLGMIESSETSLAIVTWL